LPDNLDADRFDIDGLSILFILILISCIFVTISLLPLPAILAQKTSTEINALIEVGNVLDNLGNHTGAIQYYDKVLAIDPKDVSALNNKGNALAKLVEGAATANTKPAGYNDWQSVNRPYQHTNVVFYTDIALLNYGIYTQTIQQYDKALLIAPNDTIALGGKGIVLIKLHYYKEALKIFDRILAIEHNNVIGLYNKGICLDKLGEHIQAKELHNKALQINPNYSGDVQNADAVATKVSKPQVDTFTPAI